MYRHISESSQIYYNAVCASEKSKIKITQELNFYKCLICSSLHCINLSINYAVYHLKHYLKPPGFLVAVTTSNLTLFRKNRRNFLKSPKNIVEMPQIIVAVTISNLTLFRKNRRNIVEIILKAPRDYRRIFWELFDQLSR